MLQVHPLSEVRQQLSGILARFRREGAAAAPVAFGSHRKPEAVLLPGTGPTQRAFFGQLAREAGCTLAWQHLDAARNIEGSASGLVHMGNRPRAATISRCRRVQ